MGREEYLNKLREKALATGRFQAHIKNMKDVSNIAEHVYHSLGIEGGRVSKEDVEKILKNELEKDINNNK